MDLIPFESDLARQVIEACRTLSSTLAAATVTQGSPLLMPGVRPEVHRVSAVLALASWEEVVRWAATLQIDLRDLNERELAYLERVSLKLVQRWRTEGTGPAYRNEAGIRYALRDYWEWRRRGRQTMTSQKTRRGRKRLDE